MVLHTLLTEKLGVEVPVLCGGMHQVGRAELAAAVSNAGGLGQITALTMETPEGLRAEIKKCRTMTSKPFGVNLTILPMLLPADYGSFITVVCEERVASIEISGGSPRPYMAELRAAGVKVIHKSATIKHALKAQEDGVDFIEIAGFESSIAGRSSADDVTTWVLATKALEVLDTPVIISGASATGRQLAAALAMGAVGITMGTRFLATQEAPVHEGVKLKLADPATDEFSTTLVLRTLDNSTRVLKNDVTAEILRLEAVGDGDFSKIAPLAAGERAKKMFRETGDWNSAMWSCGQSVGLINDIPTCANLVARIVRDAEEQLRKASAAVSGPLAARL